ncbi:MAG TPA: recombinase family protein [Streptosporangiaceae bacterium]|nr:recombinase family protein [Streptosporangiaceae bacterium]
MAHPAPAPAVTSSHGHVEPMPVAFLGRTSTLLMQDPRASLQRQLREVKAKLPPGWFIAAHFWDIESGGLDIEQRGHGAAHEAVDVGIPRDGGLAALLAEAGGPAPRFASVMCEDIERSGRDTFNALKLERQLSDAGIPLFATDEPINVEGTNATTILVRRVKQGIAEWYRFQLKEKAWRGFTQHALDGYNIGPVPYGYTAERIPHPNPMRAAQGKTKTRLVLDPPRARVVEAIYAWRIVDKLGIGSIVARLNTDPTAYPAPKQGQGWTAAAVVWILSNPKYTGYMVYGRTRRTPGYRKPAPVPPDQWLWSPQPAHQAIITRATWDTAQAIGAEHATSRDEPGMNTHPAARRSYVLRSRCRCRECNRRMAGVLVRPHTGHAGYVYYRCTHDPANPRHQAAHPDHPKTVRVREDDLIIAIHDFFTKRIFGPDRAELLARQLPDSAAEAADRRDQQADALRKQLHKIDAAEKAHTREIEALTTVDAPAPALVAWRTRIIERFTELEAERAAINEQLAALDRHTAHDNDPSLLDTLPQIPEGLPRLSPRMQAQLFAAFGLELVYNKQDHQVTIYATITPSTPTALAALINDSEPPTLAIPGLSLLAADIRLSISVHRSIGSAALRACQLPR